MPLAFNAHPDHPTVQTLLRLHADIGGRLLKNEQEAERLRQDMRHVEAVIKMFDPDFNLRPVAVKRRKPNPWFKRGTIYRHAVEVLRVAEGPLTSREIATRMLAAKGVTDLSDLSAVRDVVGSVQSCMVAHEGQGVRRHGDGMPARWVATGGPR